MENIAEALELHFEEPGSDYSCAFISPPQAGLIEVQARVPQLASGDTRGFSYTQSSVPDRKVLSPFDALDAEKFAESTPFATFRQVRFRLESDKFCGISQKGNHAKFIKFGPALIVTAILPHYTELCGVIVASILHQARIPLSEF